MSRKALTSIQVYTIKKPGFHRDPMTVGLYLQVARSKTGVSRSWAYRYNSPLTGKLRFMGLGSVDVVSLADARKLAQDYRRMVRIERRDPVEERRAMKAEALKASASARHLRNAWMPISRSTAKPGRTTSTASSGVRRSTAHAMRTARSWRLRRPAGQDLSSSACARLPPTSPA